MYVRLDFKIDQYPEEMVIRHGYDPVKNIWNRKEITIKIEPTPFGNGSMRECFRVYVFWIMDVDSLSEFNGSYLEKNSKPCHRSVIGIMQAIILQNDTSMMYHMHDILMMWWYRWQKSYGQHVTIDINHPKKVILVWMLFFILFSGIGRHHSNECFGV